MTILFTLPNRSKHHLVYNMVFDHQDVVDVEAEVKYV